MAKRKLELVVTAKDQASSKLKTIEKGVEKLATVIKGAAAGVTAFSAAIIASANASAQQQSGINKLDVALKKTGSSYATAKDSIEEFAAAQQRATRFGDDETRSVLTTLVTSTGQYSDALLVATGLTQDFAEATGRSATESAVGIGKALNGNIAELQELGVQFGNYDSAQLKAMETGKRHEIVLKGLEDRFGGMAASIAPVEQKLADIRSSLGDVVEAFGDAVTEGAGLEGMLDLVVGSLIELESFIRDNKDFIGETLKSMFTLAIPAIKVMIGSLGALNSSIAAVQFTAAANVAVFEKMFGSSEDYDKANAAAKRSLQTLSDQFSSFADLMDSVEELEKRAAAGGRTLSFPPMDTGSGGGGGGVRGGRTGATSTTKRAAEEAAEVVGQEMAAALKAQFDRTTEVTGLLGGVLDPELAPIAGQRDSDAEEMTRRLAEDHEIRKGIWEVEADVRDDQTRQLESFAQSWGSFGTLFASIAAAVIVGGENMNKQLAMLATQALGQGIGAAASAAGAGPLGPIIGQAAGAVGGAIVEKMFEESSSRRRDMANAGGLGGSRTDAFGTSSPFEQKTSIYNITVRGAVAGTAAELGRSVTEWQREAQRAGMVG